MSTVVIPPGVTQASFDQAFRAAQPKAVQAFMENPNRTPVDALGLANEGYLIDMVTMYWGWSAYDQTIRRLSLGYTWVPSANMNPVSLAPGLSMSGLEPYDPTMVPPGGILLTMDQSVFPQIYAPKPGSLAAQAVAEGK